MLKIICSAFIYPLLRIQCIIKNFHSVVPYTMKKRSTRHVLQNFSSVIRIYGTRFDSDIEEHVVQAKSIFGQCLFRNKDAGGVQSCLLCQILRKRLKYVGLQLSLGIKITQNIRKMITEQTCILLIRNHLNLRTQYQRECHLSFSL